MDAVEFLKARSRMCNDNVCEGDCPLFHCCNDRIDDNMVELVSIVEQWAKAHPVKTRQNEFLKMYPNARIDDGVIFLGPCAIDKSHKCTFDCKKCCRDYWLKEIE